MRTTLSIDDDVMAAVREVAEAHGSPLGRVVSDLLRRGLHPEPRVVTAADGFPVITVPEGARPLTDDQVADALASP